MNWRQYIIIFRRVRKLEWLSLSLLAIFIAHCIYQFIIPPHSYFSLTRTPINSPGYLIRNLFREYINELQRVNPLFLKMLNERQNFTSLITDSDALQKTYTKYVNLEKFYINLENLSNDLKSSELRKKYFSYGEDGLKCETCTLDPMMYPLAIMPSFILWYLVFLSLIGFYTEFSTKKGWRFPIVLVTIVCIGIEAHSIIVEPNSTYLLYRYVFGGKKKEYYILPQQIIKIRSIIFCMLSFLVVMIDLKKKEIPSLVSLKSLTQTVEICAAGLQAARLARTSIMQSDDLRRHCWDYYKKVDQIKQHLFNDPEYQKMQSDLNRKYQIEALEKKTADSIRQALDSIGGN